MYLILALAVLLGAAKVTVHGKVSRNMLSNTSDFSAYNAIVFFAIGLIFAVRYGIVKPTEEILIYALMYGIFNALFQLLYTIALKTGPISISALLSYFSVGATVLFGLLYYNEKLSICNIIGLILMVVSMVLSADLKNALKQKMSTKWLMSALGAMIVDGAAAVSLTMYAKNTASSDNQDFLAITYLISAAIMAVFTWVFNRKEHIKIEFNWKNILAMLSVAVILSIYMPLNVSGAKVFPSAVYFPILHTGIICVVSIIGMLFFKDKLKKVQTVGLILGIAAVILLSL